MDDIHEFEESKQQQLIRWWDQRPTNAGRKVRVPMARLLRSRWRAASCGLLAVVHKVLIFWLNRALRYKFSCGFRLAL